MLLSKIESRTKWLERCAEVAFIFQFLHISCKCFTIKASQVKLSRKYVPASPFVNDRPQGWWQVRCLARHQRAIESGDCSGGPRCSGSICWSVLPGHWLHMTSPEQDGIIFIRNNLAHFFVKWDHVKVCHPSYFLFSTLTLQTWLDNRSFCQPHLCHRL